MVHKLLAAAMLLGAFHFSMAQVASTCQSVYQDSVRNVEVNSRVFAERNSLFTQHCEANGSLKTSSTSLDLTLAVKVVEVGFSGSRDEAQQKMQRFCKSHSEASARYENVFQASNSVVVDALRSYNQCIDLERRDVRISHVATDARSVLVSVFFNPATSNVALDSVQYDQDVAKCTSNVGGGPAPKLVTATSGEIKAKAPFSIACERTPSVTASGERKYPRLELLVSTNQGPYSVTLPTEEMLGYDLATINKRAAVVAAQERADLQAQVAALRALRYSSHSTTQGEGNAVACPQAGGNINVAAQGICGAGEVSELRAVYSHGGGKCGHTTFTFLCLRR